VLPTPRLVKCAKSQPEVGAGPGTAIHRGMHGRTFPGRFPGAVF
jgi:hypothetical protein